MRLIVLMFILFVAAAPARADDAAALRGDLTSALKDMQSSREAADAARAKRLQDINARVLARQQQRAEAKARNEKVRAERLAAHNAQKQAATEANLPYYLRTIPVQ